MNTQLLLIRHGDVVYVDSEGNERPDLIYNGDTAQLTDLGRQQLESLGQTLGREGVVPGVIYSSDYRRAVDSSEALVRGLGKHIPILLNGNLRDVVAPNWDGITRDEFIHLTLGDIYYFAPQTPKQSTYIIGQESLEQIINRQRLMRGFIRHHKEDSIAFVGHGDQMSALHWALSHESEVLPFSYWEMKDSFYLDKAEAHLLTLDPTLRIVGEGRRIRIPEVDASVEGWRRANPER